MPEEKNRSEQLKKIKEEILGLTESPLYGERVKNNVFPVIGEGSHDAKIMFVGEAPGENEARTGRPFCGAAGRILDKLLEHIGLDRKSVYVTNIVKDRPPKNRDPMPKEIELYAPFLDRQIEIIQPEIVVTLGRFSMDYLMRRYGLESQVKSISQVHGQVFETEMKYGRVKIVPMFHPAVACYHGGQLGEMEADFEKLKEIIKIEDKNEK